MPTDAYHALRLEEIELTADYLMKKQEEREAAREERARLREERKVQAELAAERERLNKERSHLLNALEAIRSNGSSDTELERKLAELDEAIAQNDYRAANIRAGYVSRLSYISALPTVESTMQTPARSFSSSVRARYVQCLHPKLAIYLSSQKALSRLSIYQAFVIGRKSTPSVDWSGH